MNLIVKPHKPWRARFYFLLFIIMLATAGWTIYEYGRFTAGFDSVDSKEERIRLLNVQKELEDQVEEFREQKAILERASQIEKKAYVDLKENLRLLQEEIVELKEELAFYRGIVSPANASAGLRLQRFELEPNGQKYGFRSKVVLTQVLKNDRLARGYVRIKVEGLMNDQAKTLDLAELTENHVKEIKYRFKYFQTLENDLILPKGFTPLRATIQVVPSGKSENTIEKTIEWPNEENHAHVGKQQQTT